VLDLLRRNETEGKPVLFEIMEQADAEAARLNAAVSSPALSYRAVRYGGGKYES
jgi:hypothetical protein